MGVQKEPLTTKQLDELEKLARGHGIDHDIYKTFMILRYTGQHVSVINTPSLKLHEEIDDDGDCIIAWLRPKKSNGHARTSILKHKSIDFDVGAFAEDIQKRKRQKSRQYFWGLMKKLGQDAGISDVSPMTFRHSLAIELLNGGASEVFVAQILNCSKSTLRWYGKYTDQGKKEQLKSMGW